MLHQNTDIAWNGMMLQADVMLLCTDTMLLPIHTCTRWCYIMVLHYKSLPTLRQKHAKGGNKVTENDVVDIENLFIGK